MLVELKKLARFYYYQPDAEAEDISAFVFILTILDQYCFPSFSCTGKVPHEVRYDVATRKIIAPIKKSQYWFTMLLDHLTVDLYI